MRIISSFKDYYDCGQAAGQDPTIVYVRESRTEQYKNSERAYPFPSCQSPFSGWRSALSASSCVIGFCGRLYGAIQIRKQDETAFCYDMGAVEAFIYKHGGKDEIRGFDVGYGRKPPRSSRGRVKFERFFQNCQGHRDRYEKWFIENRCPIFVAQDAPGYWDAWEITYNARLKDYEFFRVFDPWQAFQELQMCFGGILAPPEKPMPPVSDKDMRDIKGFDEWSFKKMSEKERS